MDEALSKREMMERLLLVWEANPRLRFGQLFHNATSGVSVEYLFDDELVRLVELYLPKGKKRRTKAAA